MTPFQCCIRPDFWLKRETPRLSVIPGLVENSSMCQEAKHWFPARWCGASLNHLEIYSPAYSLLPEHEFWLQHWTMVTPGMGVIGISTPDRQPQWLWDCMTSSQLTSGSDPTGCNTSSQVWQRFTIIEPSMYNNTYLKLSRLGCTASTFSDFPWAPHVSIWNEIRKKVRTQVNLVIKEDTM